MSRLYKDGLRLRLVLNKRERKTLTHIRNLSSKPYQRERAAALLKIASSISPHAVALHGLLRQRDPDTVYSWVYAFDTDGIKSLSHAPRKRKDSLSQDEQEQLFSTITEKSPQDFSLHRSRWTLKTLRDALPFLKRVYDSISGIWRFLRRKRIHYKRSLDFVPCPDPSKEKKIRRIRALLGYARKHPTKVVSSPTPKAYGFCSLTNLASIVNHYVDQPGGLVDAKSNRRPNVVVMRIPKVE